MSEKKKNGLRKISQFTGRPVDTILIIGSLAIGIIAAYAWKDLSDEVFARYFPKNSNAVKQRLFYAIVVTILAVIIIIAFAKVSELKIGRGTTTTTVIQTTTPAPPPTITPSIVSNDF